MKKRFEIAVHFLFILIVLIFGVAIYTPFATGVSTMTLSGFSLFVLLTWLQVFRSKVPSAIKILLGISTFVYFMSIAVSLLTLNLAFVCSFVCAVLALSVIVSAFCNLQLSKRRWNSRVL